MCLIFWQYIQYIGLQLQHTLVQIYCKQCALIILPCFLISTILAQGPSISVLHFPPVDISWSVDFWSCVFSWAGELPGYGRRTCRAGSSRRGCRRSRILPVRRGFWCCDSAVRPPPSCQPRRPSSRRCDGIEPRLRPNSVMQILIYFVTIDQ